MITQTTINRMNKIAEQTGDYHDALNFDWYQITNSGNFYVYQHKHIKSLYVAVVDNKFKRVE